VRSSKGLALLLGLLVAAITPAVHADGPGEYRGSMGGPTPDPTANLTKEERAIKAYNEGYRLVQKGDDFAAQSSSQDDKAWKESQKAYKSSLKKFEAALKQNPRMHEAYTYIGYAQRKMGNYEAALAAYEQALRLKPSYPPAIEYQGEAFLGVNRVNDAKSNYLQLYALDQAQARKLLRAIKQWSEKEASEQPNGVDVSALKAWVNERELAHDPNEKPRW
jgi:tetratricopeptide (TPR) repeat protein